MRPGSISVATQRVLGLTVGFSLTACSGVFESPQEEEPCDMEVYFARSCASNGACHVASGKFPALAGRPLGELQDEKSQVSGMSIVEPGHPENSWLYIKMAAQQGTGEGAAMPLGTSGAVPSDLERVAAWIKAGAPSCGETVATPVAPNPNNLNQQQLFTCIDPALSNASPARLRRLNKLDWVQSVGPIAPEGVTNLPAARSNPLDPNVFDRFSTYSSTETLDVATLDFYLWSLPEASKAWTNTFGTMRVQASEVFEEADFRCIHSDNEPSEECMDAYVRALLEHGVYYRPPSEEEVVRLMAVTRRSFAKEPSFSTADERKAVRPRTLRKVTSAAWTSVGALFRTELGQGPMASDRVRLSGRELAHKVAYALFGKPAGALAAPASPNVAAACRDTDFNAVALEELLDAADDGRIFSKDFLAAYVRNHVGGNDPCRLELFEEFPESWQTPQDKTGAACRDEISPPGYDFRSTEYSAPGVRRFFRELFDYSGVLTRFKDSPAETSRYSGASDGIAIELSYKKLQQAVDYEREPNFVAQLDDTIARVVVSDRNVFQSLLTTGNFFLPSSVSVYPADCDATGSDEFYRRMQKVYVDQEVGPSRSERWKDLSSQGRGGVLTHPAWLAAHGGNFENDPSAVERGHWIRNNLLCLSGPTLEGVTVNAQLPPQTLDMSARERLEVTNEPDCNGCHSRMNPLGMPFEVFNHAGFVRTSDHGTAPSGAALLTAITPDNPEGSVPPGSGLEGAVNSATEFTQKLGNSPHVKRCLIRQSFRYFMGRDETMADACTLQTLEQSYDSSNGSFSELLVALITSDAFMYRAVSP